MKLNNVIRTKRDQRGITLVSVAIIGVFLACALMVAFKCIPVYAEYFAIKRLTNQIATNSSSTTSDYEMKDLFDRGAMVDDIYSVKPNDLEIYKESNKVVIETDYERVVPLVANISLLFAFKTSTRNAL